MIKDVNSMECVFKHKDCSVLMVLDKQKFKLKERLICADCLEEHKGNQNITLNDELEKLSNQINTLRKQNIYEIDQFTKYLYKLKENLIKVVDIVIVNSHQCKDELNKNNEDSWDEEQLYLEAERINKINKNYQNKLVSSVSIIKQIINIIEKETDNLKNVLEETIYYEELKPIKKVQVNPIECPIGSIFDKRPPQREITYHQIQEVYQEQWCFALAFNKQGSIMAGASKKDIKIWNFEKGQLRDSGVTLKGHNLDVTCIIFSKKMNWFITGSIDCKIIGWKKMINSIYWEPSQPCDTQSIVWCLLLNQSENLIFSGHSNGSIKVWTLNTDKNQLMFHYQLNKHSKHIGQMSMNEDETQLVSCSDDKTIIVWEKKANERRFKFKQVLENLKNDNGFRVCFLNKDTIAWCQENQGSIHIYKQEVEKFVDKKELQINLKNLDLKDGQSLFPSIYNKAKQIFIIKHNKYVNILSYQNQSFNVQIEPIDCRSCKNYGNITEDGNYLIVWNDQTLSFHVYELKYQ
ncbi:unnamed protein product [Paramecium pentaurelia]|uniref:IP5PC-F beta-propeller domain-containing protein n=1 Tax=Paramecium pentaurelia TaxID=43138 RepID=A0A8S1SP22_9CILI|nr:unnamed protein product [Paramecium pentaurelia]